MSSLFHIGSQWRGASEFHRWATPMHFGMFMAVFFATITVASADDRTMHLRIGSIEGNPPRSVVVEVTAGSQTNRDPSRITFYVEYSDDLSSWKPLSSFEFYGTNTQASIVTVYTYGLSVGFVDLWASRSQQRYYRAVEITSSASRAGINAPTQSLDRTRAGRVSFQCGNTGLPASLSSVVECLSIPVPTAN
jgi:hypothetical protein